MRVALLATILWLENPVTQAIGTRTIHPIQEALDAGHICLPTSRAPTRGFPHLKHDAARAGPEDPRLGCTARPAITGTPRAQPGRLTRRRAGHVAVDRQSAQRPTRRRRPDYPPGVPTRPMSHPAGTDRRRGHRSGRTHRPAHPGTRRGRRVHSRRTGLHRRPHVAALGLARIFRGNWCGLGLMSSCVVG